MRTGGGAACRSACDAFGTPELCCTGEIASSTTCRPSPYSEVFKAACLLAYSYAFDDATSTFTCTTAQAHAITFCPNSTPRKKAARSSYQSHPAPRTTGLVLQDDSWLASLATGSAMARRVAPSSSGAALLFVFMLL